MMDKIEKICQEIGRLKGLIDDSNYYLDNSEQAVGYESALDDLNEFIGTLSEGPDKSLEQEQPEVELDNLKIMKEIKKCGCNPNEFDIARHFYELGLNARKEGNK